MNMLSKLWLWIKSWFSPAVIPLPDIPTTSKLSYLEDPKFKDSLVYRTFSNGNVIPPNDLYDRENNILSWKNVVASWELERETMLVLTKNGKYCDVVCGATFHGKGKWVVSPLGVASRKVARIFSENNIPMTKDLEEYLSYL